MAHAATDIDPEHMIRLWNDGMSAAQIAGRLGLASRNVVIGRINRLADKGDGRITRLPGSRPIIARAPRLPTLPRVRPVKSPKDEDIPEPDDTRRISLLDIKSGKCRYIIGEPSEMICCGHDGFPYCPYHHKLAHTTGKADEADVET